MINLDLVQFNLLEADKDCPVTPIQAALKWYERFAYIFTYIIAKK